MTQDISYGGRELKEMFTAGGNWLEKSVPEINSINVFPVPDGDTGTNMHLTMRATLEEADRATNDSVAEIARAMAQGALMGARGNSGVILSQFFRGLAKGFGEKQQIDGGDWAEALTEASHTAYKGLSKPAEGTMLTVIREAATAAETYVKSTSRELVNVMEVAVNEARDSVSRTPLLLPVLKEAGVVDAGGQGIYVLLEGALRYLKGEADEMEYSKPALVSANLPAQSKIPISAIEQEEPYGYCTNFLLVGNKLSPDKIRQRLEGKGQSVVVAGDSNNIRVHIHTYDPGAILRYATSLGTLHHIQIQNMDDQHEGFIEMHQESQPAMDIAVVAVAAGGGISEVFKSLGTAAIVPGGQTMNPSVKEILETVDAVPSERVIILPNNKNIVLTASQVESLTSKKVAVIPTKTIPQGIAALLSFNYEGTLEDNVKAMEDAVALVKTVEITKAVRSTQMNGLEIKEGQIIGIIDDSDIVATGDGASNVLFDSLGKAGIDTAEVVTMYYGNDVQPDQADEIIKVLQGKYPEKQVELINGGQPHYDYIVSLE
jgi:DAK2 domain fusion protein YloV